MTTVTESGIIYIIGVGRSGTSLLMTLLNGHSQIAFTPETHFLRFYLGNSEIKEEIEGYGPDRFKKMLDQDDYFNRLQIPSEVLLRDYLHNEKPFDLKQVYLDMLQLYLDKKGKRLIGDKDPRYIDYLNVVKDMTPNAKVIHIYRDPRDVVLSKTKAHWSAHRPYWLNAMISQIQLKDGRKRARELFDTHYYELSYESLITDPEVTLSKLLGFLKLKFEPDMLELKSSASELVDQAELQWKDQTFNALQSKNKEKWKKSFSPLQIRCIEIFCKEWFDQLGYSYSKVKISPIKEAFLQGVFRLAFLQDWLYHLGLKRQKKQKISTLSNMENGI